MKSFDEFKQSLQEKAHTVPVTKKEKDLAALAEPKGKITHADVMKGRGVNEEEELDEAKSATHSVYNVGAFVHTDSPHPGSSKIHKIHRVTVRRGDDEEKRAKEVVAKHYGDTKHEITSVQKGQFNRQKPDLNKGLSEADDRFANLPGKASHILNKDIRHPEHGIIAGSTVLRHIEGNKYEVRAGRAKGKIVGLDSDHVNKLDEEVEQIDEISTGKKMAVAYRAGKRYIAARNQDAYFDKIGAHSLRDADVTDKKKHLDTIRRSGAMGKLASVAGAIKKTYAEEVEQIDEVSMEGYAAAIAAGTNFRDAIAEAKYDGPDKNDEHKLYNKKSHDEWEGDVKKHYPHAKIVGDHVSGVKSPKKYAMVTGSNGDRYPVGHFDMKDSTGGKLYLPKKKVNEEAGSDKEHEYNSYDKWESDVKKHHPHAVIKTAHETGQAPYGSSKTTKHAMVSNGDGTRDSVGHYSVGYGSGKLHVPTKKVSEEVEGLDERLTDDAKKNINRALGSKQGNNPMRKDSSAARAMIKFAKEHPKNVVQKEEVEQIVEYEKYTDEHGVTWNDEGDSDAGHTKWGRGPRQPSHKAGDKFTDKKGRRWMRYKKADGSMGVRPVKEEVEQIDELSKGTLSSYIKKASGEAVQRAHAQTAYRRQADDEPTQPIWREIEKLHNTKKGNRMTGIRKAADKLAKEEVELDEARESTHENPLITIHKDGRLHAHLWLSTANDLHKTDVKHTQIHAGPVKVKTKYGDNFVYTLSKHHGSGVKEQVELNESLSIHISAKDSLGNEHHLKRRDDGTVISHNQHRILVSPSSAAFAHRGKGGTAEKVKVVTDIIKKAKDSHHAAQLMNSSGVGHTNWKAHSINEEVELEESTYDKMMAAKQAWASHPTSSNEKAYKAAKELHNKNKAKASTNEEVEQIDELSKTTVKSYEDKARMDQNDTLGIALRKYSSPEEKAKYKAIADKRGRGRDLALAKLSPKGTRLYSDRTVAKQAKVVATEQVEHLDEAKNPYSLYDDHKDFATAHADIHAGVEKAGKDKGASLRAAMKKHRKVGAQDTESEDRIHKAVRKMHGAATANSVMEETGVSFKDFIDRLNNQE